MPNFLKNLFHSPSLEEELINLRLTSKQMQRASKKCEKNEKAAVAKVKKVRTSAGRGEGRAGRPVAAHPDAQLRVPCPVPCAQAIAQGNSEGARIYAQDAIREKNQVRRAPLSVLALRRGAPRAAQPRAPPLDSSASPPRRASGDDVVPARPPAVQALNCLRLGSRIDAVASRLETAVRMNQVTSSMQGVVKGMDKGLASMDVDRISAIMDKFERQFEDLDVKAAYMDTAMNATTASATPADQVDDLVKMVADENNLELGAEFSNLLPVGKIRAEAQKKEEEVPPEDDLQARLANLRG